MRNFSKVTALAILMSVSGASLTAPVLAAPDYAKIEERKKANVMEDSRKKAYAYCDNIKSMFDDIRYHADKLEIMVDDEMWPLPKLRELLFTK